MGVFVDRAAAHSRCGSQPSCRARRCSTRHQLDLNELHTRDLEAAKTFYPKVFGWGVQANEMPGMGQYVEWQVNGRSIAGGMAMNMEPESVPTYWLVYFTVADTDAIVKRTPELGGKVISPAMDIPQGRFAVLTDPQGAASLACFRISCANSAATAHERGGSDDEQRQPQ